MLVTIHKGVERSHIILDTGMSPDGMTANMRRLGIDPRDVEIVVLSRRRPAPSTGGDGPHGVPDPPLLPVPRTKVSQVITVAGVNATAWAAQERSSNHVTGWECRMGHTYPGYVRRLSTPYPGGV